MITRQQSLHTTCAISACLLLRKCWAIGNRREIFHHKFGFTELEYNNLRNSSCNFESVHVIFRHAQKQYCWWLGIPNLSWKCYGCLKGPDMNKKNDGMLVWQISFYPMLLHKTWNIIFDKTFQLYSIPI